MTETNMPRLIVSGDRIVPKGTATPEVVRSVSIVIHMANGVDYTYSDGEEVVLADPGVTPSEEAVLEALQREVDQQVAQEAWLAAEREQRLAQARLAADLPPEGTIEA